MTKKLQAFISFFVILFIFAACQKEFTIDEPNKGGTAVFTLSGAPGNCVSPVVNGIFQVGTVLDTSNRILIRVNVISPGSYNIVSSSANGINFSASDTFTVTGLQTIAVKATGTPVASGRFDFVFGSGGCTFSVTCSGPAVNNNCKDCIYIPFCIGSTYVYSDTLKDPLSGTESSFLRRADYISSIDTTIDGRVYKKIEFSTGTATTYNYINCLDGETRVIAYNVESTTSGNILLAFKTIELKANAAIGSTWSDTTSYASGNFLYRKHTLEQKGTTRSVLGINYNDVIKVSVDQSTFYVDPPLGLIQAGVTEYYFAKGIGLIETITYGKNPLTGASYVAYHSVLNTYVVP